MIKGIHRMDEASDNTAHANVYLVINDGELAVVDSGTQGNAQKIVDYIEKVGYRRDDVKTIILTHFHMDHMGSAKELKDLTNAKVAVHEEDAGYVSGEEPMPAPKNSRFRTSQSPQPVHVDVALREGDKIADLIVLHMPGHTPGSIMLLDERRKCPVRW